MAECGNASSTCSLCFCPYLCLIGPVWVCFGCFLRSHVPLCSSLACCLNQSPQESLAQPLNPPVSERPGLVNEVSDSGLMQTNRAGLVSSRDPRPLPVAGLWERARVTPAAHLRSIPPLLSLWKSDAPHTLISIAPHTLLVTGKSIFGVFRGMLLCGCSCESPVRRMGCWETGTSTTPQTLHSFKKHHVLFALRVTSDLTWYSLYSLYFLFFPINAKALA